MEDERPSLFSEIIILTMFSILVFICGSSYGINQTHKEAIKNSVAEWKSDKDGKAVFAWKTKSGEN